MHVDLRIFQPLVGSLSRCSCSKTITIIYYTERAGRVDINKTVDGNAMQWIHKHAVYMSSALKCIKLNLGMSLVTLQFDPVLNLTLSFL